MHCKSLIAKKSFESGTCDANMNLFLLCMAMRIEFIQVSVVKFWSFDGRDKGSGSFVLHEVLKSRVFFGYTRTDINHFSALWSRFQFIPTKSLHFAIFLIGIPYYLRLSIYPYCRGKSLWVAILKRTSGRALTSQLSQGEIAADRLKAMCLARFKFCTARKKSCQSSKQLLWCFASFQVFSWLSWLHEILYEQKIES